MKSTHLSSPNPVVAAIDSSVFDEPTAEYEQQLVSAMLAGDKRAFDAFYQLFVPRLYRFIYYAAGNHPHDAEDILQDTMLAAVRSLARFQGKSRLYTWLYAIAQHKIHDYYRKNSRANAVFSHDDADEDFSILVDESPSVERQVIDRDVLHHALAALPVHYRTVLIGKYVEGFSVHELSQAMDRSEKSVESLLTRARSALRKQLANTSGA